MTSNIFRTKKRTLVLWLCTLATIACQPAPKASAPPPVAKVAEQRKVVPTYPAHFQAWLAANPDQMPQLKALEAYLGREGVADVLPLWQLIQTETVEAADKCEIEAFAIPPQDLWPTMVPTLRLVKQEIIPLLGPVKVLSSFRTNAANRCSFGAPESPHKRYAALDLAMVEPIAQKDMFAALCKHWDALSPSWGYGLGAYYSRRYPEANSEGRFHVDTLGRRTWGHSYGAYTSHCRELGYISVKSPEQIKAEEEAKLKAEADAKAKLESDAKLKLEAEAKAKAASLALAKQKATDEARIKALELDKLAVPKDGRAPAAAPPEAQANTP
jgi:Peptidase M15